MVTISGSGKMDLSASFPVHANLSPFQAEIDEAIRNALVKFGIVKDEGDKIVTEFTNKSKRARDDADAVGKMVLRKVMSETMQTIRIVANAAGWSKNQTYQMYSQMITGIISMISTMALAASSAVATYGPIVGPIIAGWNITNAAVAFGLQTTMQGQQSAMSMETDSISAIMETYRID